MSSEDSSRTSTVPTVPSLNKMIINSEGIEVYETPQNFDNYDIGVVCIYFLLVLAVSFYSMFKSNRGTISGYFLAGRYMFWIPVGASLFASNIGSEHFIGLAGSGSATGLSVGAFEMNAMIILQLSAWIFLPVFIASRVCTLPEYMSKRFGGRRIRTLLALLSVLLYIFTKVSVNLFSGAIFIQQALQWNLYIAVLIILVITAVCTIGGGLTAVIYTDTFQFFIMIFGAVFVAVKAFIRVGGYEGLQEKYMKAIPSVTLNNSDCGFPTEKSWTILRSYDDRNMPWLGFILGQTPASIWYWATDQMMVQRLLAAKSLSHAQGGTLFAGFIKFLPLFVIIMPGMISRVLYTDEVACVDPKECYKYCQNEAGCSNVAYPRLVLDLMPSGLRGLMMSVMLAAIISDLTSVYNSASTLFSMDIWPCIRKDPSVREVLKVGRLFVLVMVGVSILWIPVIQNMQGGQLFIYIQVVSAYLSPPIAAVYLLAVLWKRMNEKGAFWALIFGLSVGITRMVLDFVYHEPGCGEIDERPVIIRKFHYMYFACLLFWLTIISSVIISLKTEKPKKFMLIRTTFWTRRDVGDREDEVNLVEIKQAEVENHAAHNGEAVEHDTTAVGLKEDEEEDSLERTTVVGALRNFYSWFCGLQESKRDENQEKKLYEHLEKLASLHQTPFQKLILNVFLATGLGIAFFVFFFYSGGHSVK